MDKNSYCVIMAGGIGSRFWPLSRTSKPKQFLDILGTEKTLLQQTVKRFLKVCPRENIFIVSNFEYGEIIKDQLPDFTDFQIMLEPMRKNTAPCIAYANYRIKQVNPSAIIIVAPSDHLILDEGEFIRVIKQGLKFAGSTDALLTLGIKPSRPETGYGYIQGIKGIVDKNVPDLMKVKTFTEKPDYEMAKVFLRSGDFYWNSGIFMWSLKAIEQSLDQHLGEMATLFNDLETGLAPNREAEIIHSVYSESRNISIDYGIMEKADNVFVLAADFGWSDLGTWSSLYDHLDIDKNGNAISGDIVMSYDSEGCIVNASDGKLVVIQGLKDYIVVDSGRVLLICKKSEEQSIKQIVNDVKVQTGEEFI
ncbi:MAG: mannose-1-phosphate guanylyltransferase [Bacteroidota bacterium]|nr:mannose-1-phosphate guanylyltransferase [Bacteroidota bacterium]